MHAQARALLAVIDPRGFYRSSFFLGSVPKQLVVTILQGAVTNPDRYKPDLKLSWRSGKGAGRGHRAIAQSWPANANQVFLFLARLSSTLSSAGWKKTGQVKKASARLAFSSFVKFSEAGHQYLAAIGPPKLKR